MNGEPSGTSGCVVDASIVAKWYLRDEEFLPQADALLDNFLTGVEMLASPHFARYELANAVTRAVRLDRISGDDAASAVRDFAGLQIARELDSDSRLAAAASLAGQFGVSFYDALYLALAEELNLRLVTADRQFYERVAPGPIAVAYIDEL